MYEHANSKVMRTSNLIILAHSSMYSSLRPVCACLDVLYTYPYAYVYIYIYIYNMYWRMRERASARCCQCTMAYTSSAHDASTLRCWMRRSCPSRFSVYMKRNSVCMRARYHIVPSPGASSGRNANIMSSTELL